MKTKLKICANCNFEKVIWKQYNGERFCAQCWNKIKPKIALKRTPLKNSQKPIAKRSDKRAKQELVYNILRKSFLNNHPICQAKISPHCKQKSDQVHHRAGRIGDLLCNDSKFLAVCDPCHKHIENNREEAIELEFSELRTNK